MSGSSNGKEEFNFHFQENRSILLSTMGGVTWVINKSVMLNEITQKAIYEMKEKKMTKFIKITNVDNKKFYVNVNYIIRISSWHINVKQKVIQIDVVGGDHYIVTFEEGKRLIKELYAEDNKEE